MMGCILRAIAAVFRGVGKSYNRMMNFILFKVMKVNCRFRTVKINGRLLIRNHGSIEIGDGCCFNSGRVYNLIGGDDVCSLVAVDGGSLKIGKRCQISNAAMVASVSIELGEDVFVGGGVKIYDTDFHPLDSRQRIEYRNEHTRKKPISIGDGAFIGAHSIILKGVSIGKRAVIGAGSVVTKNVGDDEIWGGAPARLIRKVEP